MLSRNQPWAQSPSCSLFLIAFGEMMYGRVHSGKRGESAIGRGAQCHHERHVVGRLEGADVSERVANALFHPDLALDREFHGRRIERLTVREGDSRLGS